MLYTVALNFFNCGFQPKCVTTYIKAIEQDNKLALCVSQYCEKRNLRILFVVENSLFWSQRVKKIFLATVISTYPAGCPSSRIGMSKARTTFINTLTSLTVKFLEKKERKRR